MNSWQFTPFAIFYLLGAMISFYLAYKSWKMRKVKVVALFSFHFLGTGIWSLSYLLGFFNTDVTWKLLLIRTEYLGMMIGLVFFVLCTARYTQYDRWINPFSIAALAFVPAITFVQLLFFETHTFFYQSHELGEQDGLVLFIKQYGVGFYLWTGFAYLCLLWSVLALVRSFIFQPKLFRNQLLPISVSLLVLIFISLLYITNNNPIAPYDPTPLSVLILGIMTLILMGKFRFLDLIPAAHFLVFKNLQSSVIVLDGDDRIIELNPAAERLLRKESNEVVGHPISSYLPDFQSYAAHVKAAPEQRIEIPFGTGQNEFFEIQINALKNGRGKLIGSTIMMHDVTKLRNTVNELNAYAHMVAHDLKDPLSQQLGIISLLESKDYDAHSREELYQKISTSSLKMNEIIDSLLLLSDVRNKKVSLVELDMEKVVKNVLDRLAPQLEKSAVEVSLPETWPSCVGYGQWIEEIWYNYLQNAIKYGGQPPKITLGATAKDSVIQLWVKDNGKGLTPEEQHTVFEEFNRLEKHERMASGHGLGLSVVKRIMNRMGGQAWAESDGKTGSTFFFSLSKK